MTVRFLGGILVFNYVKNHFFVLLFFAINRLHLYDQIIIAKSFFNNKNKNRCDFGNVATSSILLVVTHIWTRLCDHFKQ